MEAWKRLDTPLKTTMTDTDPFDEDGDEYELEPVDPEILEMERERIREKARQAELAIDVNEVYEDTQSIDPITWDDFRGFRFTTRHLLIATAIVAIALTLYQKGSCLTGFLLFSAAVGAGWYFVIKKERRIVQQRQLEREARRRQITDEPTSAVDYSEFEDPEETATPVREFRFAFSMKEMLGAMTVAAIVFALVRLVGGADSAALCLGLLALVGLALQIIGFELPPLVVLCWWLIIVLYVIVSLITVFTSSGGGDAAAVVSITQIMQC